MTNILTDTLPVTTDISGEIYQLNADFRTCLKIICAFEDNDLTPQEKSIVLLSNLFANPPSDTEQAITAAREFLNGDTSSEETTEAPMRLYSFTKDASYIYAAFRQTHGIDLQTADLHWYSFLALFQDLGQDTTFCQLVNLRRRIKTGKASKEERQAAREMGEILEVPEIDARTLDEKEQEAEFMRLVNEGYKK